MSSGALTRYRVMAYVTGVMLLLGCFVAIPLQVTGVSDTPGHIVWTAHGWLYVVYVVTALDLGLRRRWPLLRVVLVALAGTVPFASFVAERRVVSQERRAAAREGVSV